MSTEDIKSEQFVILGVALSAIVSDAMATGAFGFWDTMVGSILAAVLLGHWHVEAPAFAYRFAFAGAVAYTLLMIFGFAVDYPWWSAASEPDGRGSLWHHLMPLGTLGPLELREYVVFATWSALTAIILFVRGK